MRNGQVWLIVGSLLAAAGVALGAYHAHGLNSFLAAKGLAPEELTHRMANADTAIRYQLIHALGLMILGNAMFQRASLPLTIAAALLALGVLLFSGGLYLFVFAGKVIHWAIIPSGGLALIVGWVTAAVAMFLPAPPGP